MCSFFNNFLIIYYNDFVSIFDRIKMMCNYDTVIGESGSSVSGGERQRIAVARAILKDAPIILLDEATASLDIENESLVQQSINELVKGKKAGWKGSPV